MDITKIIITPFGTNTYIVTDKNEAAIIDPGMEAERILKAVPDGYAVKYILLTHGHFDHIMAAGEIKEKTNCHVLIHEKDAPMIEDGSLSLAAKYGLSQQNVKADRLLGEGDSITVGDTKFSVLHTPGHTAGSICFLTGNTLISGDTLFYETIGVYQRENKRPMQNSLKRLLELPPYTKVYPGHGAETDIAHETLYNPYAKFNWEWE